MQGTGQEDREGSFWAVSCVLIPWGDREEAPVAGGSAVAGETRKEPEPEANQPDHLPIPSRIPSHGGGPSQGPGRPHPHPGVHLSLPQLYFGGGSGKEFPGGGGGGGWGGGWGPRSGAFVFAVRWGAGVVER